MADINKDRSKVKRERLGDIASSFGGLLGSAVEALTGKERDKKTGTLKKSKRQQMMDEL